MIIIDKPVIITIEIIYYLPDYPSLVQTFILQRSDVLPYLPRFHKFLNFWKNEIEAVIKDINYTTHAITG